MTIEQFESVKHLLPKAKNTSRPPLDNYRTLNAIFWILRTGAPWRDLPLYYGNQAIEVNRGGKNTKIHVFINDKIELLFFLLIGGEVFDSKVAVDLLKTIDITDKMILADMAYGASDIRDHICENIALSCIPDKVNSKIKHFFDKEVYKQRNIFERFFDKIKNNRHIAMRLINYPFVFGIL